MAFSFARTPDIRFGTKTFCELPKLIPGFGQKALLVIGGNSLQRSGRLSYLTERLENNNVLFEIYSVSGEPSPELIDSTVSQFKDKQIDVVVAIGGGSVVDAGKAISAMLKMEGSVLDYLEGVGDKQPTGQKVPFIAVPTTSGTGSEATKNAVISRVGKDGFKKSLRHDNYVPDLAVIDPEMMLSCPKNITAYCAMDAFSQLFESFVSTGSNAMTDALAYSGLQQIISNLFAAYDHGDTDLHARTAVAYAAMQSGITLANAGLCVVHGFASSIGGMFDIPHGVVCGTLLAAATDITIRELKRARVESPEAEQSLYKHAVVAQLITGNNLPDIDLVNQQMIETLYKWTDYLKIPKLSEFGVTLDDISRIAAVTGCKNNPIELTEKQLCEILHKRL